MEVAMGHVLTLAGPEAERITRGKNGSGQGTLIDALEKTALAKAERAAYKRRDVDTSYLCRFDDTDYCQWFGRRSDGCFHPISRVLLIVKVAAEIPSSHP
jgi:hypothetical protein